MAVLSPFLSITIRLPVLVAAVPEEAVAALSLGLGEEDKPPPQPVSMPAIHINAIDPAVEILERRCDSCFIAYSNCLFLQNRERGPQVFAPAADRHMVLRTHGILSVIARRALRFSGTRGCGEPMAPARKAHAGLHRA